MTQAPAMLSIPPMRDEIDQGYLGTLMRLNGAVKKSEIVAMMAKSAGMSDKSRREVSCLELLSLTAQIETSTFVQQHTTLPLRRGITSYLPDLEHGSDEKRSMFWTTAMRVARPGAYCCPQCVKQDQESHGTSYWHRQHQIPGLLWCPEHKVALHYMDSTRAYLYAPEQILNECHTVSESWINKTFDTPSIHTFLAISSALLWEYKPFSVKHVSAILKEKAESRGYQTYAGKVKAPLLSDTIVAEFGKDWLATIFPRLADNLEGKLLNLMDGVLFMTNASSSAVAYILALSVLFDSENEALNALTRSDTTIPEKPPRKAPRMLNNDELRSAYIKSQGSYSKTANNLETSYAAVCERLRSMGLPNLNGASQPGMERAAVAFFVEGKSLAESAVVGNVTCNTLENLVRVAGVNMIKLFQEMKQQPQCGRGSGVRRPLQLSPHEVIASNGRMAVKFSPDPRHGKHYVQPSEEMAITE